MLNCQALAQVISTAPTKRATLAKIRQAAQPVSFAQAQLVTGLHSAPTLKLQVGTNVLMAVVIRHIEDHACTPRERQRLCSGLTTPHLSSGPTTIMMPDGSRWIAIYKPQGSLIVR